MTLAIQIGPWTFYISISYEGRLGSSFKISLNMLILILVSVIFCLWAWCIRKAKKNEKEPPVIQYNKLPLVGHAHRLLGNNIQLWNTLKDLSYQCQKQGGVVTTYMGPRTVYVLTDPEDFLTVASTCFEKAGFYDLTKPFFGDGLATSPVPKWKIHRKLLNPAFNQTVIDGFLDIFNKQSRQLVKDLEPAIGKSFSPWNYTRSNTLETICLTALGVDFNETGLLNSEYIMALDQVLNVFGERVQKFWLHSDLMYNWSSLKKKQDELLKILHNLSNTVIEKRKAEFSNEKTKETTQGVKFKSFLDLMLELVVEKEAFTDREIREHVDTIIFAGLDTSSSVLAFTMLMVGSYPKVQEKVFAELSNVFGDDDRDVTKKDLSQLVYLEAVIKETMRIFPLATTIGRHLDKDVKLREYTLSKGGTCFILSYGVQRHPSWGPDAEEFRPERWLDPATLPKCSAAFATFSVGRRICIGKTYALTLLKTTLTHVFRKYKVDGDHKRLKIQLDIVIKPVSGHEITIERRNNI